jgi:hypothetical protein
VRTPTSVTAAAGSTAPPGTVSVDGKDDAVPIMPVSSNAPNVRATW